MDKIFNDTETNVSITFWDGEDSIFSFWSNIYPSYKAGDQIALTVTQTPIGETKFGQLNSLREFRVIKEIVHSVEQTISNDISTFLRLEVYLKEKEVDR